MRYITFVIIPPDGGLTDTDRAFGTAPNITRRSIQHINLLADETAVVIFELDGEISAAETILDTESEVLEYNVTETRESHHVYIHLETNEIISELLTIPNEYELVVDTPMVYTHRGGLRVTIIGEETVFREAMPEIPASLRFKLEQLGEYEPTTERLFSLLTDRQQEILTEAIQQGYYEVPRQVTHQDVAESLDCSGGTVGEHLRKIEAKLLNEITP
ncbi:helix-turn-helix domain-containing protein [Halocatena pleomorpha]|uniref:Bacterio-opsin activator n=1 Tax=Halocatena pleomorpha TaxID=1785090 RepID=A0A3P3RAR1_9EURY|nr:helix-turn-helix domain-containing protein [Halocatena pleomorpha]RRJ30572.1 bacterio-opsin activator [Halocatena pleomorpha]